MASTIISYTLVALLAFTGCEKRVENANIDVVNRQQEAAQKRPREVENVDEGLTMKEVQAVLGSPDKVHESKEKIVREVRKVFAVTTWVYRQKGEEVELSFIDGKLQGKVPHFGDKLDPQAPLHMKGQTESH